MNFTKTASLLLFLFFSLSLIGCTTSQFELPCIDLPGTEATCDENATGDEPASIQLQWDCAECVSVRQGYAPLSVSFWIDGISPDPEAPILWEIESLNAQFTEKEFTKSSEKLNYIFESEDVYSVRAFYNQLEIDPLEIRVDVNEVEANWSTPWIRGELCDARIHMLADPEHEREVPYFIEVIVKKDGLEAIKIRDWVPYKLRFPEHVNGYRITPYKAPKPYRFPAQIEPQVILFDAAGPLNQVWDVEVQCLHSNKFEEMTLSTRL